MFSIASPQSPARISFGSAPETKRRTSRATHVHPSARLLPLHVARHAGDPLIGTTAIMGGAVTSASIMAALKVAADPEPAARPKIAIVVSSKASDAAAKKAVFEDSIDDDGKLDPSIEHYFQNFGFEPVFIPITVDNHELAARDPKLVELIDGCDAVYLCGGDQAKHVHCLLASDGSDTPVMSAIRRVRDRGGVVSGSSAGAAAQGSIQYGVGRSYAYLVENRLDVRAIREGTLDDPHNDRLGSLGLGLGLVGKLGAIVCTHFDESYRLGRLLVAIKEADRTLAENGGAGSTLGIGVDEDTAMLLSGDIGTVYGQGGVFIVDSSDANYGGGKSFEVTGVRLHHLHEGDAFDFAKRELIPSKERAAKKLKPARALVSRDFLEPREASRLLAGLEETSAQMAVGYTKEKDPQFVFTFTKDADHSSVRCDVAILRTCSSERSKRREDASAKSSA